MTVRNSVYKCAENVKSGDETKDGIVIGIRDCGYLVELQYGYMTKLTHKFSQVEVYENAS